MFHRILVGVDDTPASSAALRQTIELVDAGHGRLGLLSSAPRPTMVGASPTIMPITRAELTQELIDWAQHNLAAAEEMVPQEIPVTKLLAHGSPWRALLREAHSGQWDLIVVGQTHRAWWPPFLARVGERLNRRSPTPVLVVHEEPPAPQPARGRRFGWRRNRRPSPARVA
jgi:nucleotide-binding universal stress UspA family protein